MTSTLKNTRIALTFGDAGENHTGMEMVGKLGKEGSGFTKKDLLNIKSHLDKLGYKSDFHSFTLKSVSLGGILIVRNFLGMAEQENLFQEQIKLEWDQKYWDTRRSEVLNKHARANILFLEGVEQSPDYENKKGTIIDSNKLEYFSKFKTKLIDILTTALKNDKAKNLICEGNKYFDLNKCGIGYHGDTERRKVICLSLGGKEYPMNWVWFQKHKPIKAPYEFKLNSGDLYIMSEKAVGNDWKKSNIPTLRHAAGVNKYISLNKYLK